MPCRTFPASASGFQQHCIARVLSGAYADTMVVPFLCASVKHVTRGPVSGGVEITLSDPTGEVQAAVHEHVLQEMGDSFAHGCVLALRRVPVVLCSKTVTKLVLVPQSIASFFT